MSDRVITAPDCIMFDFVHSWERRGEYKDVTGEICKQDTFSKCPLHFNGLFKHGIADI